MSDDQEIPPVASLPVKVTGFDKALAVLGLFTAAAFAYVCVDLLAGGRLGGRPRGKETPGDNA